MKLSLIALPLLLLACAQRDPMGGIWISDDGLILELEPSWSGSRFALIGKDWSIQGTYSVEGEVIILRSELSDLSLSWTYPFELTGETLTIGGVVFERRR